MRTAVIFLLAIFVVGMILAFACGQVGQALEARLFPDDNAAPAGGGGAGIQGPQVK